MISKKSEILGLTSLPGYEDIKDCHMFQFEDICNRFGQLVKEPWIPRTLSYNEDDNLVIHFGNGFNVVTNGSRAYIDFPDYSKVTGFSKLSEPGKELFIDIWRQFSCGWGIANKARWIPKKVIEHRDHLEVHFSNKGKKGDWYRFFPDGTWS